MRAAILALVCWLFPFARSLLSLTTCSQLQKGNGGQVNIFQTSLPTTGPGALKHREDNKLYGTDKEKTLFVPNDPFYRATAEECVELGIGINVFLFPTQYIDVASIGAPTYLPLHRFGADVLSLQACSPG